MSLKVIKGYHISSQALKKSRCGIAFSTFPTYNNSTFKYNHHLKMLGFSYKGIKTHSGDCHWANPPFPFLKDENLNTGWRISFVPKQKLRSLLQVFASLLLLTNLPGGLPCVVLFMFMYSCHNTAAQKHPQSGAGPRVTARDCRLVLGGECFQS